MSIGQAIAPLASALLVVAVGACNGDAADTTKSAADAQPAAGAPATEQGASAGAPASSPDPPTVSLCTTGAR